MIMYFHYLISKIEKNPEISSRCISYNTMQVLKAKSSFLGAIILDQLQYLCDWVYVLGGGGRESECHNLKYWAQFYKGWITLANGLIVIQQTSDSKTYSIIHGIEIYPVDRVIQPLNNQGMQST